MNVVNKKISLSRSSRILLKNRSRLTSLSFEGRLKTYSLERYTFNAARIPVLKSINICRLYNWIFEFIPLQSRFIRNVGFLESIIIESDIQSDLLIEFITAVQSDNTIFHIDRRKRQAINRIVCNRFQRTISKLSFRSSLEESS